MTARVDKVVVEADTPAYVPAKRLRYVLIVPVWGEHHTSLFLRYCIPFLLTDGNVRAFAGRWLQVHVASTRSDFLRMRQDHNYQLLAAQVELVETVIDDVVDRSVPHRAMTECYVLVLRGLPASDEIVTIFPTPDCILSRHALSNIVKLMEDGWRAVMVCGLRLTLETVGPLLDNIVAGSNGADGVSERELCSLALNHIHPISLSCDVESNEFMVSWPSHVYWTAPDRSWLFAHCFHLHPIAVRGIPAAIDINTTIDGDYLLELGIDIMQIHVCSSSDEFFCVELSPEAKRILTVTGRVRPRALVRFSVAYCNRLHRQFFPHAIWFRGPREPNIPDQISSQAAKFVTAVERGSTFEVCRHVIVSAIRRIPPLRFVARLCVGVLRRLAKYKRELARKLQQVRGDA